MDTENHKSDQVDTLGHISSVHSCVTGQHTQAISSLPTSLGPHFFGTY